MKIAITDTDGREVGTFETVEVSSGEALRQLALVHRNESVIQHLQERIGGYPADEDGEKQAAWLEQMARLHDMRNGAHGLIVGLFLGRKLADEEVVWKRGFKVWTELLDEGWSEDAIRSVYKCCIERREDQAYGRVKSEFTSAFKAISADDDDAIIERALWVLSARQWGHSKAWRDQEPDEVGRLLACEVKALVER